jgi:hypothetical protein
MLDDIKNKYNFLAGDFGSLPCCVPLDKRCEMPEHFESWEERRKTGRNREEIIKSNVCFRIFPNGKTNI